MQAMFDLTHLSIKPGTGGHFWSIPSSMLRFLLMFIVNDRSVDYVILLVLSLEI